MFLKKPILAIFAHPDDESFLVGGALALAAKNTHVKIIIATRGEKGRSHIDYEISDHDLASMREQELAEAVNILNVECNLLDYKDGELDKANEEEIVARLIKFIRDFNPHSIITFGPDGVTGHRDHIAIGKFTTKAVARIGRDDLYWIARPQSLQNIIESRSWKRTAHNYIEIPEVPYTEDDLIRVDVSEIAQVKSKAILSHASQGPERYLVKEAEGLMKFEYFYKVSENILKNYH